MAHGQSVEMVAPMLPTRQKPIHQGHESGIMSRLQQVHQLVHQNVFQALPRLFRQVCVEADCVAGRVATAPACLHALDEHPVYANT